MRGELATAGGARALAAWVGWVVGHPRATLLGIAALVVLALFAATRLSVDTDSSRMLDPGLDFQKRAHAVNAAFPELKNSLILVVRGPRRDPVEAAVAALAADLVTSPAIQGVFAPSADPFFARTGLLYLEREALEARLIELSKSANLIAGLRVKPTLDGFLEAVGQAQTLAARADIGADALDRLYAEAAATLAAAREGRPRGFAWSEAFSDTDGSGTGGGQTIRVVAVTPALDFAALNPARPAMRAVSAAVAGLPPEIAAEVEIGLTGDPVLRADELRSVTETIGLSLAASLLLVGLVLRLALGSFARMGLALAALTLTLVLTTGAAATTIGALNLVSVAFVVLMVGLGIDFAIHLMSHIAEDAQRLEPKRAIVASAAGLGPALLLTAATTSVAFLVFATTDFIGMAQLGIIGGIGVLIAFFVAVTLIPAVMALRPGLVTAPGHDRGAGAPVLQPLRSWRDPGPVGAALALLIGLGALAFVPQVRFDADPMALRDPGARSVEVYDWLAAEPDLAPLRLDLLTTDPETAARTAARLAELPQVGRSLWLGDLVPSDQDAKLDLIDLVWPSLDFAVNGRPVRFDDPEDVSPGAAARKLAEKSRNAAAQALAAELSALAEGRADQARAEAALFRYFPLLIDRLRAQLNVDRVGVADLPARLAGRYRSEAGLYRVEIAPSGIVTDPAALSRFTAAVHALAPEAAGPPEQITGAGQVILDAMLQASLLALGATALLAVLALRRGVAVAAILVPVALAGALTCAATVLLGQPFNYANVIVLPLLIGIGVDAGIHLALREDREGQVFATATPKAVVASALTTIGAFATLAISDHRGTASMGLLLAVAVTAAVAMAFALTPALLRLARRTRFPS